MILSLSVNEDILLSSEDEGLDCQTAYFPSFDTLAWCISDQRFDCVLLRLSYGALN